MEIVNISYIGSGQVYQDYRSRDTDLILSSVITPNFGSPNDYVEFFVYDENSSLISSNYNLISYKPESLDPKTNLFTAISVDPREDLESLGINRGTVNVQYNFLRGLFNSSVTSQYFIKEISTSRTEIKLASLDISNIDIQNGFSAFQTSVSTNNYYNDFYLNFGLNELVLGINAAYSEDETDSYLLVKLYEPLPSDFDVKSPLWIVEKAAESVSYEVDIQVPAEEVVEDFRLRGPNFSIRVNDSLGQTTPYYNYNALFSAEFTSSVQQLKSWYEDKAIEINVDYTNFQNFIHFSSATERINNFVYKLQLIEGYEDQIRNLRTYVGGSGTLQVTSASIASAQNNINRIVEKFDTYEYYLYFSSESFAWPKNNSIKPYSQVSVTSSAASNWLGSENTPPFETSASLLFSSSIYDAQNQDRLTNAVPAYIVDDSSNAPYLTFLNMVGQHFDNVWIYYKDVSNRYNAANNPQKGISKDQVADALRSLGMEIYTNSTISDSVYFSLFGINPDGSLLPPTGSEMITQTVTSSLETLASREIEKEVYKRIYHNLPYLLKSRGTQRGIKALIACYGIPESILSVKEFGGYDRYEKVGILDSYDDKIQYYVTSSQISSSFLSPFSTVQYYNNDDYINSTNVEVAFSPADLFNAHITSSLPNLSLENVIGSPGYLLSSSYEALDKIYENYLRDNYVTRFNLWDYVRLVKFYNNSLFKMIKDFVPARSNVSTGIVIRDHILHRNKYQRYDPEVDASQYYSQSIDTAFIEAGPANELSGSSTSRSGFYTSSVGYIPFTTTDGVEKYTGDFQGSTVTVTTLNSFNPQFEYSFGPNQETGLLTQSLVALYQNVSQSLRSRKYFDLDYTYQQNVPVNLGVINYAISKSESGNPEWQTLYNDPNVPFAYLQDYNYATNAFTIPRYFGSKVQSSKYTFYVEGESGSLGKTAAIDKEKYQFAYLVDIYTSSLNLPGRSNSQIKYILDNGQNVLDLTKANENIFFTQNIFKSGETVNVSLFDYDPRNPDVQILTNKKDLLIYEGGWRYSPNLYWIVGSGCLTYKLDPPEKITSTTSFSGTDAGFIPYPGVSTTDYEIVSIDNRVENGIGGIRLMILSSQTGLADTAYVFVGIQYPSGQYEYQYVSFPPGNAYGYAFFPNISLEDRGGSVPTEIEGVYKSQSASSSGTITTTTYRSEISDCDNGTEKGVYAPITSNSSSIWLSVTQSSIFYYDKIVQDNISYESMETPVFKISFQLGDMVKFKDQVAYAGKTTEPERVFWPETEEYRVVSTQIVSDANNERRVQLNLDRTINPAVTDNNTFPSPISFYIFNKHVPDETNVIVRYDPKANITQDGLLYPEYLRENERIEAGNTIKSLKSQNLI